jgi:hypothetical protein
MRARRRTNLHALPGRADAPDDAAAPSVPGVRLGRTVRNGVAPSMFGLLERGVGLRPDVAAQVRGKVVFRFTEPYSPLRVNFASRHVTVEDGDFHKPDLAIIGSLPDIVHFVATPLVRGIPNPARIKGLVSIARVARRRVKIEGDPALARGVLRLLSL